jgi:hypothetical protein
MTTQDQATIRRIVEGSCGIRHGSNRVGMFAMIAEGSVSYHFTTAAAVRGPVEVELVDSPKQTNKSCWEENSDGRVRFSWESEAIFGSGCNATGLRSPRSKSQRGRGYYETGCEILKQVADRFQYKHRPWGKAVGIFFCLAFTGMGSICLLG